MEESKLSNPLKVEMMTLRRVMAYLSIIESVPLEEIVWTENGEIIPFTAKELDEWKFTGMNNRDFAIMFARERKTKCL